MRFDQILAKLAHDGDWNFEKRDQTYISRRGGEKKPVERTQQVPILDDYTKIIWNTTPVISLEDCQIEWDRIKIERRNEDVDRKRLEAYGSVGDQLDMMYNDLIIGTTTWKDHVASVKLNNPKDI